MARSFGITETTWYRWNNTYGGMKAIDGKRPQELEDDTAAADGNDRLAQTSRRGCDGVNVLTAGQEVTFHT